MKIILESLRFMFIFLMLLTILGGIAHLTFSSIGIAENYDWIAMIVAFSLTFVLYRYKGWGKAFDKKNLWMSVILMVLLSLVIPDVSPTHLHTTEYGYSYGFPFKFLTLYIENGSKFVIPNLFSGGITGWNVGMGLFGNIILFNFSLHFICKKLTNETRDLVNKES
ncbi:hypothetical protein J8TS2_42850 [Lederbergia ruris]|uniref:Uncharacterized protein n=1 Tax=Lederbergia ruris TaxID=217495 RepID=A0ABQ4KR30_9BACI|nr:hypothetical protein [Lederbergia ruris]GIN59966.1 hypothetical protein J8TS2_42850 [Lederbergia ruris]